MLPQQPRRRLSSRAVKIGMVSTLSLFIVSCNSDDSAYCADDTPSSHSSPTGYPGFGEPTDSYGLRTDSPYSEPTDSYTGYDDDDECDSRGGFGGSGSSGG